MSEDFVFFVDEGIDEFKDETPSQVRQRTINGMTFTELHLNSGCITVHDCIFVRLRRGDNYYYAEPWIENERYQILDTIYQVLATLTFDPDHQ